MKDDYLNIGQAVDNKVQELLNDKGYMSDWLSDTMDVTGLPADKAFACMMKTIRDVAREMVEVELT